MNIFLIPYTNILPFLPFRYIAVGLVSGGAALLVWWFLLTWMVVLGPGLFGAGLLFDHWFEGAYFLAFTAGALGALSIWGQRALYRRTLWERVSGAAVAGAVSYFGTLAGFAFMGFATWLVVSDEMAPLYSESSLVTLRYRLPQWLVAGWASAVGPLVVRREGLVSHLAGGIVCGGVAGAVWHWLGFQVIGDYYVAAAAAWFTWGLLHGLLLWGIPNELYAAWIRVLSQHRYGYRIPVDRVDAQASERFLGHFPRGLDLFLPVDHGVAELHTSFLVDDGHNYAIRGLSQYPTYVKRFLERIDLRYDPRRPAPLQTELEQEDRVIMSDGRSETIVEFVLLPKEER